LLPLTGLRAICGIFDEDDDAWGDVKVASEVGVLIDAMLTRWICLEEIALKSMERESIFWKPLTGEIFADVSKVTEGRDLISLIRSLSDMAESRDEMGILSIDTIHICYYDSQPCQ
jgi:hypothetical protein